MRFKRSVSSETVLGSLPPSYVARRRSEPTSPGLLECFLCSGSCLELPVAPNAYGSDRGQAEQPDDEQDCKNQKPNSAHHGAAAHHGAHCVHAAICHVAHIHHLTHLLPVL